MIDVYIVVFYVLAVLVIGIFFGLKVKDLQDYSVARGSFSSFVLCAAIFGTLVGGGSTLGVPEKIFSHGIIFFSICLSFIIRDLIIVFLIVPHFDRFRSCLTVGDIMAIYFGRTGKNFIGIAGTLQSIIYLSIQYAAIGQILHYFTGLPYWFGLLVAFLIIMVYSTFGGIKAVTITDVIKFSVLMIAIPVTLTMSLDLVGGLQGLLYSIPPQKFSLIPSTESETRLLSLALVFIMPNLNPALTQRLLMGKTVKQVQKSLIIATMIRLVYYFMVGILGLVAFVLEPTIPANLAFPFVINHVLPVGIKGLVICGVMAVIISAADSFLHVAGLLLTHDVIKPLIMPTISEHDELKLTRVFTALAGLFALMLALFNQDIIELNFLAYIFWLPTICLPLIFSILGGRTNVTTLMWSSFFGILTYFIWRFNFIEIIPVDSLLPAVMVHTLVFFTFVAAQKISWSHHIGALSIKKIYWPNIVAKFHTLMGRINLWLIFRQKISRLINQSRERILIFGAPYGLFVSFALINICVLPLLFSSSSGQSTESFIVGLRILASGLSFLLIMKDFWPKKLLPYLPIYWHITLFFCLPFFTISMCLFSSCSIEWVIDLVLTNFILGLLVDWKTYSATIMLASISATIAFFLCGDVYQFDPSFNNFPIMAYGTGVSLVAGALFSRSRERVLLDKLHTFKALSDTIAHEMRTPLSSINISAHGMIEHIPALIKGYQQAERAGIAVPKIPKLTLDSLTYAPERMRYICSSTLNIIDMILLELKENNGQDHFAPCSIKDCIDIALMEYCFKEGEKELVRAYAVKDFIFFGNKDLVVHIIFNLMRNSLSFIHSEKKGSITIWTTKNSREHSLHFHDTAKGIRAQDLPYVFDLGFSKRQQGSGVGLYYCKKMMASMSGTISLQAREDEFAEFILTFPNHEPFGSKKDIKYVEDCPLKNY